MKKKILYILTVSLLFVLAVQGIYAQEVEGVVVSGDSIGGSSDSVVVKKQRKGENIREYTREHPLIYEDKWDLWPYAFLNERGVPSGFNVELVRMLMNELHIPYIVRMKDNKSTFEDLRDGRADLTLGLSVGYYDEYGLFSQNPVTLFTISAALPKSSKVSINSLYDLADNKVIVRENYLVHNVMKDHGWEHNVVLRSDMREALLDVAARNEGIVVGNTLTLRWLARKYDLSNLKITSVSMPYGEYKFMSNNPELLARLDSAYSVLEAEERVEQLRDKWFYPDREERETPVWVKYAVVLAGLLLILFGVYFVISQIQCKQVLNKTLRQNKRMRSVLSNSHVRICTYDVAKRVFTWYDEKGQPAYSHTVEELDAVYHPDDLQKLTQVVRDLVAKPAPKPGEPEPSCTMNARVTEMDKEDEQWEETASSNLQYLTISVTVCQRDKEGNAVTLLGTRKYITAQYVSQRLADADAQRHKVLCETDLPETIDAEDAKSDELDELSDCIFTARNTLQDCRVKMDGILEYGHVRLVRYSLNTHTLVIQKGVDVVQHSLTQTRCMTLVSEASQKRALHAFYDMDARVKKDLCIDINTSIRAKGGNPLCVMFYLTPVYDRDQRVTEYFGACVDVSELSATMERMQHEAAKVQEVENIKMKFIKNMVEEIRTPMNTIVKAANDLQPQQENESNLQCCDEILDNAGYLLHLIDNILYLSRLEAHMIDIVKTPSDFVDTFATYCVSGRMNNDEVAFLTESPFEQLVVDIDSQKLGNVIERLVDNAIRHTHKGFIRARYEYIGRKLMISIEDTGDGIAEDELERLNALSADEARTSEGLGIPICKELLEQMGGGLEISSEVGYGTVVWVTLPCQATVIKRKKLV